MNTLYLYVLMSLAGIGLLAGVHEMTFDDEQRQQELYCELVADGVWPQDARVCP